MSHIENLELKSTVIKMKNFLEGLSSRREQAEERFSVLEDLSVEIVQSE